MLFSSSQLANDMNKLRRYCPPLIYVLMVFLLYFQIISAFSLYIWCAAADPADPGVFKSKKYLKVPDSKGHARLKGSSKLGGDSTSSINDANAATIGQKPLDKGTKDMDTMTEDHAVESEKKIASSQQPSCFMALLALVPCAFMCNGHDESSEQHTSEDGMFYCSLCEVEVCRYIIYTSNVRVLILKWFLCLMHVEKSDVLCSCFCVFPVV